MQGPIFKLGWDQTHYRPRYIFLIQCAFVSYCSLCHSSLASEPFPAQVWLSLGLTLHTQNTLLKVWSPDTPQCQEDPISFDIGAAGSTHNTRLSGSLPRLLRLIPHHPWEWAKHLPLSSYHHCLCQSLLFSVLGKWTLPLQGLWSSVPFPILPSFMQSCLFSYLVEKKLLGLRIPLKFPVPPTCGWFTHLPWLIILPTPCRSEFDLNF